MAKGIEIEDFTLRTVPARLKRIGDLWKPLLHDQALALTWRACCESADQTAFPPMEALLVEEIPEGAGWEYSPNGMASVA